MNYKALQILDDLHANWKPHDGQIEALKPVISDGFDTAFISSGRKWGKDFCLEAQVLTDKGWVKNKNLKVGDTLFTHSGHKTKIIGFSKTTDKKTYRLIFNDGTHTDCSYTHRWLAYHGRNRELKTIETKDILEEMLKKSYKDRPTKIPLNASPKFDPKEYKLDPYLLGLWLGDGSSYHSGYSTEDLELLDAFIHHGFEVVAYKGCDYRIQGLSKVLRSLNLLKNKHIPKDYLLGAPNQRLALLQGLMDTDGHVDKRGQCEFVQKNVKLFNDFVELARSCGIRVNTSTKTVNGTEYQRACFKTNLPVFQLSRKLCRLTTNKKATTKTIVDVQILPAKPMRCIAVDHPDHTFIIENYTVTHNTETALYALWRHALLNPGSACFYITPEMSHGREIIWNNGRLKRFGPDKYVEKVLSNESRLVFKNGSFVKIIGSENWGAANGLTPDFVVYDEFKEFHPQFHTEMNPNRLVRNAPLIIIGTPPTSMSRNIDQYMDYKEECESDADKTYIRQPSWANPHVDKDWLAKEKERLFKLGDENIWYREYEAKIVPGGRSAIFPMFNRDRHLKDDAHFRRIAKREGRKIDWYCGADPATVSTFGGLIVGIHSFTKRIYIFSELYEKDRASTSVRLVYPRLEALMYKWRPNSSIHDGWFKVYDEREAWFANEVMSQYGVYFSPSQKNLNKREDGINLLRDIFTHDMIDINEECVSLITEIEAYSRDGDKIRKGKDHLIDTLRYVLAHNNYNMVEALEKKKDQREDDRLMRRLKDDEAFLYDDETDWTQIGRSLYDPT